MEAATQNTQRQGSRLRKAIRKVAGIFREVIVATIRYSFVTALSFLIVMGFLTLYDIFVGDDVPHVSHLGIGSRERITAYFNATQHLKNSEELDPEECWRAVQPTLQILDRVCPEAANWVRDRHQKGKIVWEAEYNGCYAKYDYMDKVLTFNKTSFAHNDGIKATIFAHEYRHSIQNFTKFFKAVAACMISREPHPDIVEDDANLFEQRVLVAIFL